MKSSQYLRLVGADDPQVLHAWREEQAARRAVAAENRAAASNETMSPTDPRWALAVRTHTLLEGAQLAPEKREKAMRTARALGVRPFEANMVIALVQDQARRGGDLRDTESALKMIGNGTTRGDTRSSAGSALWWLAAVITAVTIAAIMIRWLVGA